jgi:hypothetical protein
MLGWFRLDCYRNCGQAVQLLTDAYPYAHTTAELHGKVFITQTYFVLQDLLLTGTDEAKAIVLPLLVDLGQKDGGVVLLTSTTSAHSTVDGLFDDAKLPQIVIDAFHDLVRNGNDNDQYTAIKALGCFPIKGG